MLHDNGIYDYSEAAALLGVSEGVVSRIMLPTAGRNRSLVTSEYPDGLLSFRDLIALGVVVDLRGAHDYDQIWRAVTELERRFGPQPLSRREVLTRIGRSGTSFLVKEAGDAFEDLASPGQKVIAEAAEPYFRPFEFDDDGNAVRWRPATMIVLDPKLQCGAPCVEGSRVRTDVIADLLDQGVSPSDIAETYDLETSEVEAAAVFEATVASGGLALVEASA